MKIAKFKKTIDQTSACKLLNGDAKHILLFGGSRSGKTFIIVRNIILRALKADGSRHCILRKTFTDVRRTIVMDTMPKVLQICFPSLPITFNKSTNVLMLPNKSEIWFGGLDKTDKILGNEYATMYFNEISEMIYSQLEIAYSRLAQKTILVNKFYYDCNPPSKSHWSYKLFHLKQNPSDNIALKKPNLYTYMRLNPDGNKDNLTEDYIEDVLENMSYKNRQRFLLGEFTDDNENALWKRSSMINPYRYKNSPADIERVVVAIDPAVTNKEKSDLTGIVIVGRKKINGTPHYFVLDDRSLIGTPREWATSSINAYHEFQADRIVAETNNGGDMVEATLRNADERISYAGVRATRGKIVRAEPIAELYERGLVHHVGEFPLLEDEMCSYCGFDNEKSPDRMDALVWGLTYLSGNSKGSYAILSS